MTTVTEDKICEAAVQIASRDGLLAMMLENVAKEAGITKGGVMSHFPSKADLIRGVMEDFTQQVENTLMRRFVDDPEPRFHWARSMLDCVFPVVDSGDCSDEHLLTDVLSRSFMATLTGAVTSPEAMQPLRELSARMRSRCVSDPRDGVEQLLVWLTIDGLFLWQFMGLIKPEDPLIPQIGAALRKRIRDQMAPPIRNVSW